MAYQQWKAEKALEKSRDAKEKRKSKSTKNIPLVDSDDYKSDKDTEWSREISSSSDD